MAAPAPIMNVDSHVLTFHSLDAVAVALRFGIQTNPHNTSNEWRLSEEAVVSLPRAKKGTLTEAEELALRLMGEKPTASIGYILNAPSTYRQALQRAASRTIVRTIEAADGFKYKILKAWTTQEAMLRMNFACIENRISSCPGYVRLRFEQSYVEIQYEHHRNHAPEAGVSCSHNRKRVSEPQPLAGLLTSTGDACESGTLSSENQSQKRGGPVVEYSVPSWHQHQHVPGHGVRCAQGMQYIPPQAVWSMNPGYQMPAGSNTAVPIAVPSHSPTGRYNPVNVVHGPWMPPYDFPVYYAPAPTWPMPVPGPVVYLSSSVQLTAPFTQYYQSAPVQEKNSIQNRAAGKDNGNVQENAQDSPQPPISIPSLCSRDDSVPTQSVQSLIDEESPTSVEDSVDCPTDPLNILTSTTDPTEATSDSLP
ncbi:hypothetical protein K470DRAFT_254170 [Piedraia hortae CBS 480.64]|uniref:Uncharacterized protein n=1 Tax=Piedraia hortae CBS 480.64 TaxID=1314780 RepID=A0A6A7CAR7_9PEZI|nr:hypothetical protein K470DRAFT_254170 [Piedraia hortae CBS 480.64]